jgi:hypothetical protein
VQTPLLAATHKLDYFNPISFQEDMGIVTGLRNNLQAYLHGHPITADPQIFKQTGDGTAVPDVGGISVYRNLHGCLPRPENQDESVHKTNPVRPAKRDQVRSQNIFFNKTAENIFIVLKPQKWFLTHCPASQNKCVHETMPAKNAGMVSNALPCFAE